MSDLVVQGLNLAMVGMGFVFLFLTLLVVLTMLMSALVLRLSADQGGGLPGEVSSRTPDSTPESTENKQLVAVISAAVRKHRAEHRQSRD